MTKLLFECKYDKIISTLCLFTPNMLHMKLLHQPEVGYFVKCSVVVQLRDTS